MIGGDPVDRARTGRIIAVAGGKGGVGKSCIALNLALALGQMGRRVVIVDADLGAANLHTMLGVNRPGPGIDAFLDGRVASLDEVAIATPVPSVKLVPGTSRVGSADIDLERKLRLLHGVARLAVDAVVIDIGAGTSLTTIDLVGLADIKLMVVTPQLTSIQNAYALLKGLVHRALRRLPLGDGEQAAVDAALTTAGEGRTIVQLLVDLGDREPALGRRILDTLDRFGVALVGNMLARDADGDVLERVSGMIRDRLSLGAPVVGTIRQTPAVSLSLAERVPVVAGPTAAAAAPYRRLAATVAAIDVRRLRTASDGTKPRTIPLWILREHPDAPAPIAE